MRAASLPVFFVFIWATGFIVARLVAPHTEPFTFLTIRVTLTSIVFALVSALAGARWPARALEWTNALIAGVLLQGVHPGRRVLVRRGMGCRLRSPLSSAACSPC